MRGLRVERDLGSRERKSVYKIKKVLSIYRGKKETRSERIKIRDKNNIKESDSG